MGNKLMMKKFIVGLVLATVAFAQSGSIQNSIYRPLFSLVSSPQTTLPVLNAGQTGHQVNLVLSNNGANTCLGIGTSGQLEQSYDNVNWTPFGYPTGVQAGNLTTTYFGAGAFPYVRYHLIAFDTVNCLATANYSGSLPTNPVPPQLGYSNTQNLLNAGAITGLPIPLQNSGQTGHVLYVTSQSASGHTCAVTDKWEVFLNGTVGNATGLDNIVIVQGAGVLGFPNPAIGYGIFGTLSVTAASAGGNASTDCTLTVIYVGTGFSAPPPAITGNPIGVTYNPTFITQCGSSASFSVTAGNTTAILGGFTSPAHVCGLVVTGNTVATVATIKTGSQTTTPCDTGTATIGVYQLGAGTGIAYGGGLGDLFETSNYVCVTAATGTVSGTITYAQLGY